MPEDVPVIITVACRAVPGANLGCVHHDVANNSEGDPGLRFDFDRGSDQARTLCLYAAADGKKCRKYGTESEFTELGGRNWAHP